MGVVGFICVLGFHVGIIQGLFAIGAGIGETVFIGSTVSLGVCRGAGFCHSSESSSAKKLSDIG